MLVFIKKNIVLYIFIISNLLKFLILNNAIEYNIFMIEFDIIELTGNI